MSNHPAEEELAIGFADWLTMTGASDLAADAKTRELIHAIKARAWDEGAENAWSASGEGWNGEYAGEHGTHDGEVGFLLANGDHNPYRRKA